ncbi:MAG: hypothetical protein PVF05_05545 [Gemmatimonadales bacterium]|jgi:hypothetical protein
MRFDRAVRAFSIGLACCLAPGRLPAQGYRAEVSVGANYLEARPILRDSLPEGDVPGDGLRRRLVDGTVVTCAEADYCRWYSAGAVTSVGVMTQEVAVTGWSGVQGLSAHVRLRGRYGTDDFWPQSAEDFELVSGYVDYDRGPFRVRLGRLFRRDGLGYYNFDGGSFLWRKWAPLWIEAYGGWGLARGLNFPRSGDLMSRADPLAPDDRGFIFGAAAGVRAGGLGAARISYQREIRTDRLALYGERVALDARAFVGPVIVEGSTEYDLSYRDFNEARLRLAAPLISRLSMTVEARHHAPFFELWTIWGAFNPVGFDELALSASWAEPSLGLDFSAGGAHRVYGETDAGPADSGIRDDGWRTFASVDWRRGAWFASAGYRGERGFGAAHLGADIRLGRYFDEGTFLSARGSTSQTFGEFRLNEQRISSVGVDGAVRIEGALSLNAGVAIYRVRAEERPSDGDWTQTRAYGALSYQFGTDTGGD